MIGSARAAVGRRAPAAPRRELVVQTAHSVCPRCSSGDVQSRRARTDLLASRFYGRLGYAWWFERGKIADALDASPVAESRGTLPADARARTSLLGARPGDDALAMAPSGCPVRTALARDPRAARRPMGTGAVAPLLGGRPVRRFRLRASSERMREALELLERRATSGRLNNCRLQIAMARYRLGDLAGRRRGRQAAWDGGTRHRRRPSPRDRVGGDGRSPPTARSPRSDPHGARTLERGLLTIAGVMQAEGVRLLGSMSHRRPSGRSRRASASSGGRDEERGGQPGQAMAPDGLLRDSRGHPAEPTAAAALVRRARLRRPAGEAASALLPQRSAARPARARAPRRPARPAPPIEALFARSIEVATGQGALAETLRTRISRGEVGGAFGWTDAAADGALAEAELRALLTARGTRTPTSVAGISADALETGLRGSGARPPPDG